MVSGAAIVVWGMDGCGLAGFRRRPGAPLPDPPPQTAWGRENGVSCGVAGVRHGPPANEFAAMKPRCRPAPTDRGTAECRGAGGARAPFPDAELDAVGRGICTRGADSSVAPGDLVAGECR